MSRIFFFQFMNKVPWDQLETSLTKLYHIFTIMKFIYYEFYLSSYWHYNITYLDQKNQVMSATKEEQNVLIIRKKNCFDRWSSFCMHNSIIYDFVLIFAVCNIVLFSKKKVLQSITNRLSSKRKARKKKKR